jgi:hypothetical protein
LILYAVAWWACVRAARAPLGARAVLIGAAAMRLLFVPLPPMLSDDVYRYVWEGRVQNAGFDPFVTAPDAPELAPLRDADWSRINHREYTAIYPPLAQLVFRVLAAAGGVRVFKSAFCCIDLLLVWVLIRALRARGEPPARAVLYAWNPLAVLEVASSGHMEPLGILPLVAAVAVLASAAPVRQGIAGAALAASVAVKYGALLVVPLFLRRLGWRGAVAGVAVLAPCFVAFLPAGSRLFTSLGAYAEHWRYNELGFAVVSQWILDPRRARAAVALLALGAVIGAALWRAPLARRVLFVLAIALFWSPTLHPWYLLWPLALVPLAPSAMMSAWSGTIVLAYLYAHPAFGFGPITSAAGSWSLRAVEMAPVAAAAWIARRRHT